jgi:bacterioferritin-associated ferredoxin
VSEAKDNLADEIMCTCTGTTRGQIYELFKQGKDLEMISRYSGVLSGCGGCEWDVGQYLLALAAIKQEEKP